MVNENLITIIVNTIMQVFNWCGSHYLVSYKGFQLSFLGAALSLIVARLIISIFFGGVENDDDSSE